MIRLLFHSEKGGTGKTTLSTLMAAYLAVTGRRVLMVDIDPQAHATITFNIQKSYDLYDCLVRGAPLHQRVVTPPREAWIPADMQTSGSLHVLPGNIETNSITSSIDDPDALADLIESGADWLDAVVIDSPPSSGMLMSLAWRATDYVIIPVDVEYLGMDGLMGTIERSIKAKANLLGIVPNKVDLRTVLHREVCSDLRAFGQENGYHIFEPIGLRIEWAEASFLGRMIYSIDEAMSKARLEAIRFCQAIEGLAGIHA